MPLETTELIDLFRLEMEDPEYPGEGATPDSDSLWSTLEIRHYMDRAQKELCEKVDLIPDSTSFKLSYKAGDVFVERDPLITKIRFGFDSDINKRIRTATTNELNRGFFTDDYGCLRVGNWETSEGEVKYMVLDDSFEQVRLVPKPVRDGTILLHVYRYPDGDIYDGADLEIPDRFRRDLLLQMRAMAYRKDDAEVRNEKLALEFEARWNRRVDDIGYETKRLLHRARTTQYGGI